MKLIVDSGSDLTLDQINKNNFYYLPFEIIIDGKKKIDQYEISNAEVLAEIKKGNHPKTSQATMQKMNEVFTEIAKNKEKGIYIAFSSELSGTYQTACLVRNQVMENYPELDLHIYDSKSASMGLGKIILDVNEKINQDYDFNQIDQYIEYT